MTSKTGGSINLLTLFLLFLTFLLPRIFLLDSLPANIHPDTADTLQTYLAIKASKKSFLSSYNWNGSPGFNPFIIGSSWKIFGESFFGLRFPSAIFSTLALLTLYFLILQITKNFYLSFAFSLLLSTNPWFLNFSRSGWENVFNSLPFTLILLGLYEFYQRKNFKLSLILIVPSALISLLFYHPAKLFLPSLLLTSLFLLKIKTPAKEKAKLYLFILLCILNLIVAFYLLTTLSDPKAASRIKAVSLFSKPNFKELLFLNLKNNLLGFSVFRFSFFHNVNWERYFPPNSFLLPIPIVALYLFGLFYSLKKFPYFALFYLFSLLPVEVFSLGTPDAARAVHTLPAVFAFSALGGFFILNTLHSKKLKKFMETFILLVALLYSSFSFFQYLNWITDKKTLKAREPAIWKKEYSAWRKALKKEVKIKRGWAFNVNQWKEKKK